jgi:formylglycine-generating enzyme required for sulfatase activity
MKKQTILFLAADPLGIDQLALDREARAVQLELERSGFRNSFEFVTQWAAEPLDLLRTLRKLKPTMVHFSGHGSPAGAAGDNNRHRVSGGDSAPLDEQQHGLFFQSADGRAQLVSTVALQEAFGAAGASVKLVVLNACYSETQATALLAHVDCVVGMRGSVDAAAARSFSIGFYGGLGDGESIGAAYMQGCAAISLEGRSESDRPQLKVRSSVDASQLILAAAFQAGESVHIATAAQLSPRAGRVATSSPPADIGIIATMSQTYAQQRVRTLPRVAFAISGAAALGAVVFYLMRERTPYMPSIDAVTAPDAASAYAAPARDAALPRDGMVRIVGAEFDLGVPDPASFRSWCMGLGEPVGTCDQLLGRAADLHGTTPVPTFDLDRFEVTRAQLATWLESLLARGDAISSNGRIVRDKDRELLADFQQCDPVVALHEAHIEIALGFERGAAACMTFAAATDYCLGHEAALPTLEQWQLAAAGREHRPLPWSGMTVSCSDAVFGRDDNGPCASEEQRAQSVDRLDRDVTPDGVHAMGGNVSEWVDYATRTAQGEAEHLAAGGSWVGGPADLSTIKVLWLGSPPVASTIGFRCARIIK